MKFLNIQWLIDNFRWIFFIALLLLGFITLVTGFVRMPAQLRNSESKIELEDNLVKEMKELKLPPKTAVNEFRNWSKSHSILISTRYRTELEEVDFVQSLKSELEKSGWIRTKNNKEGIVSFCRGLVDADVYRYFTGIFINDSGNYFVLQFVAGLDGVFEFNNSRPEGCR